MSRSEDNIVEIVDLSVRIGTKDVLSNITMSIPEGEIHVLLGPNGSGKTSLLMSIMGFPEYVVTGGSIWYKGQDITEAEVHERIRLGLAIAQQRPPTIRGVTVRTILEYILRDDADPGGRLAELAKATRMEGLLDRDVNHGLSGGEIKRSELMQLLALSPAFSLMDEPDSGVDIEALSLMGEIINQHFVPDPNYPVFRKAGLIITHNGNILDQLPIDKAHVMVDGKIACSGNPTVLMQYINEHGYDSCADCVTERAL